MNYFDVLLIKPIRLSLSPEELEKTYYKLSMESHPDRVGGSTEISSRLNQAYKALKNPWSRALYFLEIKGITLNDSKMPASLAELFFEIQDSDDKPALNSFYERLQKQIQELEVALLDLFLKIDEKSDSETADLHRLRDLAVERKYILSMIENLEHRLHLN